MARLLCWLFGHDRKVRGLLDPSMRWCKRCGQRV
jgi:hypothetical protein